MSQSRAKKSDAAAGRKSRAEGRHGGVHSTDVVARARRRRESVEQTGGFRTNCEPNQSQRAARIGRASDEMVKALDHRVREHPGVTGRLPSRRVQCEQRLDRIVHAVA
jgi:hypothetical protein